MRVLIVHESRYGSTRGIAERIGETLRQHGFETTVKAVRDAGDPAEYDAVVIGSATYYFRWMKKAAEFVRRHREALSARPVWLFSSGPLGTEAKDAEGRDKREVTVPKEIAEFTESIHPRDHRVFFGALIREKLGFTHRLMLKLPVNRDNAIFPLGDFRDWYEIDSWAGEIAESLKSSAGSAAPISHENEVLA